MCYWAGDLTKVFELFFKNVTIYPYSLLWTHFSLWNLNYINLWHQKVIFYNEFLINFWYKAPRGKCLGKIAWRNFLIFYDAKDRLFIYFIVYFGGFLGLWPDLWSLYTSEELDNNLWSIFPSVTKNAQNVQFSII